MGAVTPAGALTGVATRSRRDSEFVSAVADEIRLLEAWHRVRAARGGPGPDGVTVDTFHRTYGARLDRLRQDLLTGDYRPGPIARAFCCRSTMARTV